MIVTDGAGLSTPAHLVPQGTAAVRLVDYLKAHLVAVPVTEIGDLITSGFVTIEVNGSRASGRTIDILTGGDRIFVDHAELVRLESAARWNPPWNFPLSLIYEDDDVLVADKPAGMHVHPLGDKRDGTLVNALVFRAGVRPGHPWASWRPHVVQRLDCVVSGLLVVAKSAEAKAALVREQKRGELSRTYCAMVRGVVREDSGVIDAPVGRDPARRGMRCVLAEGGRRAVTHWNVIGRHGDRTLVELRPETGRTHQLRVHLASIGHPIVFDRLYQPAAEKQHSVAGSAQCGSAQPADDEIAGHAIALHASEVRFRHPRSGERLAFRLDPPENFGCAPLASGLP
jgi:23S rRNA pseudouridine1911/1915/1917 synthase